MQAIDIYIAEQAKLKSLLLGFIVIDAFVHQVVQIGAPLCTFYLNFTSARPNVTGMKIAKTDAQLISSDTQLSKYSLGRWVQLSASAIDILKLRFQHRPTAVDKLFSQLLPVARIFGLREWMNQYFQFFNNTFKRIFPIWQLPNYLDKICH